MKIQPAILEKPMPFGRFMIFNLKPKINLSDLKNTLTSIKFNNHIIIGFGEKLMQKLGIEVEGYRQFPQLGAAVDIPATHGDLFVFIRDDELGKVVINSLPIKKALKPFFDLQLQVEGFKYLGKTDGYGHDLTGYEDGTENPLGNDAVKAVEREDGSTFVQVQQWQHDLNTFNSFSQQLKDHIIGRSLATNEELDDAPVSSHVNRTDQGTFEIEADILRRSLPWANEAGEGLMFMSFCENLDRFEVQMRRMAGLADGITDALFTFSKILNSAYFYCPPVNANSVMDLNRT